MRLNKRKTYFYSKISVFSDTEKILENIGECIFVVTIDGTHSVKDIHTEDYIERIDYCDVKNYAFGQPIIDRNTGVCIGRTMEEAMNMKRHVSVLFDHLIELEKDEMEVYKKQVLDRLAQIAKLHLRKKSFPKA